MIGLFDLEAEKAIAIALVTNASTYDYVAGRITPAMFGSELARDVLSAVESLAHLRKPITPVTVQAEMVAAGRKGSAMAPGWHARGAVQPHEAAALADRVRELHHRRELRATAESVAATAMGAPASQSVALFSDVLARVQTGGAGGARPLRDIALGWLENRENDAQRPEGDRATFASGFPTLDRLTGGLRVGQLAVLGARPGNGKTALLVAIASNLAQAGVPVGIFWLEDEADDAARRFLARRLEADAGVLNGPPDLAVRHVAGLPGFPMALDLPVYVDDTHNLTMTDITARMRRMKREHGVRVFFLDHLGEVRIERDQRWGDRHDLALGRVARMFRDTAKELQAVPVLISQMNRAVERRLDAGPARMSDLDGSGQVEQAARLIAFVRLDRDEHGRETGTGGLEIAKCVGRSRGVIALRWNGRSRTWVEAQP